MSQSSYKRDSITYRREVMARTLAADLRYTWAESEHPWADYLLTKPGPHLHCILLKVYECMAPGTGDLCIDGSDWVAGRAAAQALGCQFAVARRTPDGVQMMIDGLDNSAEDIDIEVRGGNLEVRISSQWFRPNVQLPNGQTWQHLKAD